MGIRYEDRIINTLIQMKNNGLSEGTLLITSYKLNALSRKTDLQDPEEVKRTIANSNVSNSAKQKIANSYNYYAKANGITWTKPNYKWERKIPLIPTTENIYRIISASNKKYALIFTIHPYFSKALYSKSLNSPQPLKL